MRDLDLDGLRDAFGMGVAGNFAGHLEQAGEAADFTRVTPVAPDAPKGVFPWYVPGAGTFLGEFPLSADRLAAPAGDAVNLQIEPEVGAVCRVRYDADGRVADIAPLMVGAFNDCSIRRPGAPKISVKKNWGPRSKGIAARMFAVTDLEPDGALRTLRLASFLRRDGVAREYGVDSAARGYSYAGRVLLDWVVDRLRTQTGSPDTPLEPVGEYMRDAARPGTVVIGVGATRYTPFGASTFLRPGDTSVVVVYDSARVAPAEVRAAVAAGTEAGLRAASVLAQVVEPQDTAG